MGSLSSFKEVLNRLRMYGNGYSVAIVLDHRSTATSLTGNLTNIRILYTLKNKRIRLYSKRAAVYALIFDLRLYFIAPPQTQNKPEVNSPDRVLAKYG